MRNNIIVVLFVVLTMGIGCYSEQSRSDVSPGQGMIGVSMMTLTNPFFKVIGDTIAEKAATHGYDVVVVGADEDAAKQAAQVKDFIVSGVFCDCAGSLRFARYRPGNRRSNIGGHTSLYRR